MFSNTRDGHLREQSQFLKCLPYQMVSNQIFCSYLRYWFCSFNNSWYCQYLKHVYKVHHM